MLDDVLVDIAFVRTPDGHTQLELTKFHSPTATTAEPNTPANTLGLRRLSRPHDEGPHVGYIATVGENASPIVGGQSSGTSDCDATGSPTLDLPVPTRSRRMLREGSELSMSYAATPTAATTTSPSTVTP